MLTDTLTEEMSRLRAAADTFRQMLGEQVPGSAPYQALSAHLEDAKGHIAHLEALQREANRAVNACRAYRAQPNRATFDELRTCYETLLVRQDHPLIARLLPRRPAPAPRTGCRACAHALLTELERALQNSYEL